MKAEQKVMLIKKRMSPKLASLALASSALCLVGMSNPVIADQKMGQIQPAMTMMMCSTSDKAVKESLMMISDQIEVPADYLKNAQYPGPFTAGLNQIIPYENFGGDGMLTRLLLTSSKGAAWSDNEW